MASGQAGTVAVRHDSIDLSPAGAGDKNGRDSSSTPPTSDKSASSGDEGKFSLIQSIALNTLTMFGTGPFITIPFSIASSDPPGPQALIGYAVAAIACLCDSFIWAELGALFPHSGGSYVYLQKCVGDKWGRYMSFLFLWQLLITGPMEVASGFIAIAQYLAYITETYTYLHHSFVAFGFCLSCILLLYRDMKIIGNTTIILWVGMVGAIIFTLIAGFANFHTEYFDLPEIDNVPKMVWSLGNAARFGVYDFTGYYDVCFIGKDVKNPTRTIPIAVIATCFIVCIIYFLTCIAVMGYLPWDPAVGGFVDLVNGDTDEANFIMAIFCEQLVNRGFAIFFTCVVIYCIYGSCFSLLLGFVQIPHAAAQNGMFLSIFGHTHKTGFADYSLLFMGTLSLAFCFVDLETVIEGMMTTTICTMFMANTIALVYHRWTYPDIERPFRMPLYPLPCIIQFIMFFFVFITSDNWVVNGDDPLLELGLLFLVIGTGVFLLQAKKQRKWPFEGTTQSTKDLLADEGGAESGEAKPASPPSKEAGVEMQEAGDRETPQPEIMI